MGNTRKIFRKKSIVDLLWDGNSMFVEEDIDLDVSQ
jgi:hypothetical protein